MTTPRVPDHFRPSIMGYSFGAPSGGYMTDVGGGLPRVSRRWRRGAVNFSLRMILNKSKFSVWSAFYFGIIECGTIQFFLPLDVQGGVMVDHICQMVPNSYRVELASGTKMWTVSFDVVAEPAMSDITAAQAQEIIDVWNGMGPTAEEMLDAFTRISTVSLTQLRPEGVEPPP